MRTVWLLLSGLLSVVAGLILLFALNMRNAALARAEDFRREFASDAEEMLPRYLEWGTRLEAHPFFTAARPNVDAGPWLNPRVPWINAAVTPSPSEVTVPDGLHDKLRSFENWVDHQDEVDTSDLDFTWMQLLSRYGYWNILPDGPLVHAKRPRLETMPLPDLKVSRAWGVDPGRHARGAAPRHPAGVRRIRGHGRGPHRAHRHAELVQAPSGSAPLGRALIAVD